MTRFEKQEQFAIDWLTKRLQICVLDSAGQLQLPAIAGRFEVHGDAVRLIPQFSLRPGMAYRGIFYPPPRASPESVRRDHVDISIPAPPPSPPTKVTAIYPTASKLPENQLRFYIHFSAPMSSGDAYEHVKLIRDDGKVITRAFLEIGEELWDGSGTRLTLLFDPGRVKTGLKPREEFGPVLEAGKSYRLVIDKEFRDANNQPLAEGFEKRFTAGPMIEAAVDPEQWKIESPVAGTRHPLIVTFPRPLDRALLMRMITIGDSDGKSVSGEIVVSDEERKWTFTPDQPWTAGKHELIIDTALEDSAGNNLAGSFEVDVFERVDKQPGPEFVRVPFVIQ
ncbi:MAG TPA: Ig-like domain-containing protein [Pirellulaceae bacterium]